VNVHLSLDSDLVMCCVCRQGSAAVDVFGTQRGQADTEPSQ